MITIKITEEEYDILTDALEEAYESLHREASWNKPKTEKLIRHADKYDKLLVTLRSAKEKL